MNPTSRGFSLIEVVIAIGLLGIGMAASVPLVTYAIGRNAEARRSTGGQYVAEHVLQRLRLEIIADRDQPVTAIDPETVWNAPFLPHAIGTSIGEVGTCDVDEVCCNPGMDDGIVYIAGFPFRSQGEDYFVCYEVADQGNVDPYGNPMGGFQPGGAQQLRAVRVKVLWQRHDGGWSFRTAAGYVLGMGAMN